jgi:hypothetical protein
MSSSPASAPPGTPPFTCAQRFFSNEACRDEPFYGKKNDEDYCVLHHPGEGKGAEFAAALERKLAVKDYNFRRVWFPERPPFGKIIFDQWVDFAYAVFHAGADFNESKFSADAYFHYAEFEDEADFRFAVFERLAYFRGATFRTGANFEVVAFGGEADFTAVKFCAPAAFDLRKAASLGEADFDALKSRAANFGYTRISDYATFSSEHFPAFDAAAFLDFRFANVEKPERVSFRTLMLRPHWFVNVDARKFDLSNVDWNWRGISLKQELEELRLKRVATPHRVLSIACRNLALNAEENHRYEDASRFRYMAMEVRRLEGWQGWRNFTSWVLNWWYWLASGYGERIGQAFVVLIGLWLAAAALYTQVGFVRWEPRVSSEQEAWEARRDEVGQPLRWQRALTYSLGVMTLQKPEPRPATDVAQAVVMLETILGPVQAALLALAIRRKFMR